MYHRAKRLSSDRAVVFEVLRKYRRLILNPRYGYFGMLSMPYLLVYEGLGPFVETFSYALVLVLAGMS